MAKTIDIAKLSSISKNSANLLGKSGGTLGFVEEVFDGKGELSDVDQTYTKTSSKPQSGKAVASAISEATSSINKTTEEKVAEAVKPLATKKELDQYVKVLLQKDGATSYMANEDNGGLIKFTGSDKIMSKVTLFDGSDDAKTRLQIIVKDENDKGSGKVAKINGTVDGMFYIKENTNTGTRETEIATIGDLDKKTTKEMVGTSDGDVAKIQNQNDGGVMQYVKKDKSNSAILVSDGQTDGIGAEVCVLDGTSNGTRLVMTKENAFLNKGTKHSVQDADSLVVKKQLDAYVPVTVTNEGNTSYINNEKDGGIMKYIKADKSYAKFTLCDLEQNTPAAQIVVTDEQKQNFAKIDARKGTIYYAKAAGDPKPENEIATVGDVSKKIDILIEKDGNQSYMNNEKDGGILKYIKQDGTYSKVTLCDSGGETPILLQLAVKETEDAKKKNGNGEESKLVKINGSINGFYYVKGTNNEEKEENELATKGDLKPFSPAEMVGLEEGHKATCHNSADGGSLKYETGEKTAFIGVNYDKTSKQLLAEFALTEKKDGSTLKKGNRLLAKEDGIYYVKGDNLGTFTTDEIVTKKDLQDLKTELTKKITEVEELKKEVAALKQSNAEAISKVNEYTANVKTLLAQES